MPIIGMSFKEISAFSESKRPNKEININSAPSINSIKKKELNISGIKDVLVIDFTFMTNYEPKIGEIKITGEVLYQTDDTKSILKLWEEKKLDSKIAVDVMNAIFRKCLLKAITTADDLNLPPPLNFPIVNAGKAK